MLPFGKFKGKTVEEVAATDLNYLKWVLDSSDSWNRPPPPSLITAIRARIGGSSGAISDTSKPGVVTRPAAATSSGGTVSLLLGTIAPRPVVTTTPVPAPHTALPTGEDVVNFGKFRGQGLSALLADRPYAKWCLSQDFFKRNKLYAKVAKALGVEEQVTTIYSSGSSGIFVAGDGGTVAFGKYKGEALAKMLLDCDYCAWIVSAAESWDRKPRNFDQICEAAKKAKPRTTFNQQDDPWEPPEDDYELDDTPFEPPEDDEIDDAPLEDPDEEGEIDDTPLQDPEDEGGEEDQAPLEEPKDEN